MNNNRKRYFHIDSMSILLTKGAHIQKNEGQIKSGKLQNKTF